MRKISVTIPGKPIGWKAPLRGKDKRMFTPPNYRAWRDAAGWAIKEKRPVGATIETPCKIHIKIFTPTLAADGTNILKACEDACVCSGVLLDDNLKRLPTATRELGGVDKDNPRVELTLESEGE
jgi:Holliday junction resolvase RusA-like endonuclease